MSKRLVIIGAGGNAYDLLDTLDAINNEASAWEVVGFLDDLREIGTRYLGLPILGPLDGADRLNDCWFVSSIWNERAFRSLSEILGRTKLDSSRFATLLHPSASVSSRAHVASGAVIHQSASVAGNVTIGEHVSIGPGCIIGHDTVITGFTTVAAGAVVSGGARIGVNCYLGSGSVIRQCIQIGSGALIGMGAVVVNDVDQDSTVVGNPARRLQRAPSVRKLSEDQS